jgi:MFS family permease
VGLGRTFALAAIPPALLAAAALAVPESRRPARAAPRLLAGFRRVLAEPEARAGAAGLGTAAAVLALLEPLLPLELDARLGLSPSAVGLVFAAGLLAEFATAPIAGRWSDRRGRRRPLLVGGALMAAGLPLLAVGPAPAVAASFALVGVGFATIAAPSGPLLTRAVDDAGLRGMYGFSAALLTTVYSAGYAVGPLAGAALRALLPFWCVVAIAAAATAAVAAGAARLVREPRRAPVAREEAAQR